MPFSTERLRSRHPFQLFLLVASLITAVSGVLSDSARPGTVRAAVGHLGSTIWLAFLGLGAAAALVGIFWRNRATGLMLEQTGLLAAGAATLFFAVAAIGVAGPAALGGAAVLTGFGSACLVRSWQLHRLLTRVPRELRHTKRGS